MASLNLDQTKIKKCRELATQISKPIEALIETHSTVAIQRAILRLLGVEGAVTRAGQSFPQVNVILEQAQAQKKLGQGILHWFANGMLVKKMSAPELAEAVAHQKIDLFSLPRAGKKELRDFSQKICKDACSAIDAARTQRDRLRKETGDRFDPKKPGVPLKYVIVATGNIFEDEIQAKAAAAAGAEVIAVIRSTAQSLLDYVPHGATTEGFGGTYATQENFRIIRRALDEEGKKLGRYIRLTNYCSGLCMPEIAAIGSLERLDCLLNDAMYGILFRDINMKRTLIDQHFSRQILSRSKIMIQTGEDNYLTTADAIENGHQVLASQFINERFALGAGLTPDQMGLGHAQEMNPEHPNVFLLEIARAQMTRDIFPKSPIKFMPPTRFKCGDIFYSHLMDAMFNLVSVMTQQGVHLLGMPTEAMHTPLLQDRWMALRNCNYIFNGARDLGSEITYKKNGIIEKWATKVLNETYAHLQMVARKGMFKAIEEKAFADVKRTETGGKGLEGVFRCEDDYLNPFYELL